MCVCVCVVTMCVNKEFLCLPPTGIVVITSSKYCVLQERALDHLLPLLSDDNSEAKLNCIKVTQHPQFNTRYIYKPAGPAKLLTRSVHHKLESKR